MDMEQPEMTYLTQLTQQGKITVEVSSRREETFEKLLDQLSASLERSNAASHERAVSNALLSMRIARFEQSSLLRRLYLAWKGKL